RKGNRTYYYRKERAGSRVRSVYVGRGDAALPISSETTLGHQQREEVRGTTSRKNEVWRCIDEELDKLRAGCDVLTAVWMIQCGVSLCLLTESALSTRLSLHLQT